MTITDGLKYAISEIIENFSSYDWWRNRVIVPYIIGTATRCHPRYPGYSKAVRVMNQEWDTLIILDACRADVFQNVADLSRFDEYSTRISLGSHSSEWTRRNFQGGKFGDTVYVSANPHTSLIAGNAFHHVVELWEDNFNDDAGVVLPHVVRDAAIETYRMFEDKRLIVHFMQPHGPLIGSDIEGPYQGEDEYWKAYEQNLEYVLPFVYDIVNTVPGRTVITADHGQIYTDGMMDFLGLNGHKPRLRFPGLVKIPWAVIKGERRKVRRGKVTEASGERIEQRLEQLGYL